VGTFTVLLRVRANQPMTRAQLEQLDGGRHEIAAAGKPRGLTLEVRLTMAGGDVVGALARSLNAVLDVVPGKVHRAEVIETQSQPGARRRRGRR
jgi:hypothetical protein